MLLEGNCAPYSRMLQPSADSFLRITTFWVGCDSPLLIKMVLQKVIIICRGLSHPTRPLRYHVVLRKNHVVLLNMSTHYTPGNAENYGYRRHYFHFTFTCQDWGRTVLFLLLLLLGVNQVKFGGSQAQQAHHEDEHRTRASQHNSNKLPANNLQPAHVKYLILC
jgi:hypothetical protein